MDTTVTKALFLCDFLLNKVNMLLAVVASHVAAEAVVWSATVVVKTAASLVWSGTKVLASTLWNTTKPLLTIMNSNSRQPPLTAKETRPETVSPPKMLELRPLLRRSKPAARRHSS